MMALRSVLRLLSPSGPRLGPVHGVSPAAAARFTKTASQGEPKTVAEQESFRVRNKNEQIKSDKDFVQLNETSRQRLA